MKKLLLMLCLGCFSHFAATAQLDLKLDPISTALGTGDLSLEYIINGRVGLELGAGPKFGKTTFAGTALFKKTGFRGFFAAKYYFSKEEIGDGFALGVYAKFKEVTYADAEINIAPGNDQSFTWQRTGLGVMFNYKAVFDGGFLFGFELGVGGALKNQFFDSNRNKTIASDFLGFLSGDLLARVVVGYRLIQ